MSAMQRPVLILGAGGFGRAVCEALQLQGGTTVLGFLDDRAGTLAEVDGLPVLGRCDDLDLACARGASLALAIGRNADRERLALAIDSCGLALQSVVHPQAVVARSARIGAGSIVMAGAVLGANVRLGRGCIVNYGAVLDHDCQLDAFVRMGAGACLGGAVHLGAACHVQEGAVVPAGTRVAPGVTVPPPPPCPPAA
jgi:sugar O-acyltransferase (sialic acid O-acetyltransferase NeuD family)